MENGVRPKAKRKPIVDASKVAQKAREKEREEREMEEWEMGNGIRPKAKKRKVAVGDEESDEETMSGARRAAGGGEGLKVSLLLRFD